MALFSVGFVSHCARVAFSKKNRGYPALDLRHGFVYKVDGEESSAYEK